ncbi:MAG TPA: peptidyl-prolyl cis-trans isomerase [Bryobacteraceae bacterium]|nr:peptidyl-prolyl cis-trans isomerase [Bryobacteraceae bacterium]
MFDLFRSRDKAVRILLTVLLGLVGLSMVTYLIPGQGTTYDTNPADNQVLATVGKDKLTNQEVSKTVSNVTRNRQMPPELLTIYVPQIVQQMISDRALEYEAKRLGMKVSEEETDNAIMDSLPPDMVKNGKVDANTLNAVLAQQGVTVAQLRSDTERQLLVSRLKLMVMGGVVVSQAEVEKEFHKRNDKVKLQYVIVPGEKFRAEAEPGEAEIKAYYDAHKASFTTPEKRSVGIVIIDPAKVQHPPITDADLQRQYNISQDQFRTPERVQVRHILVKSDASNDAAMKTKAEGILKQLQGGADFAKLAKDNSDDPGSKEQGGELGFIVKGQTVPEFEKAAFSLPVGQLSGLVKTTYGYHILQVEKHESAHLQTLDEAKVQVFSMVYQREVNDAMQKAADRAVAELRKDPMHPEKAAAAVNGELFTAQNVAAGDPYPGVGVSKDFTDAIAPLRKGEVTAGPIVLQGNKVALASVTDYQAARPSTYEEARAEARNKAGQDKLNAIVEKKAADLVAKAKELNGDLEKAAKSMGFEVKTSADVDRQGAIEGVGSASSFDAAFEKPEGTLFGPLSVAGNTVVAKTVAKTPADMAGLAAQSAGIRDEIRQQKQRDREQVFEDGLKKRLEAEGKLKVRQDLVTRLIQTYTARS